VFQQHSFGTGSSNDNGPDLSIERSIRPTKIKFMNCNFLHNWRQRKWSCDRRRNDEWTTGLKDEVQFPCCCKFVQTSLGAHAVSYAISTESTFSGPERLGTWSWYFTSFLASSLRICGVTLDFTTST